MYVVKIELHDLNLNFNQKYKETIENIPFLFSRSLFFKINISSKWIYYLGSFPEYFLRPILIVLWFFLHVIIILYYNCLIEWKIFVFFFKKWTTTSSNEQIHINLKTYYLDNTQY